MKKLFVMAAMVLSSVGAFAQYNAGDVTIQPKVGLNVSSLTEDDAEYKAASLEVQSWSIMYHQCLVSAVVFSTLCRVQR